MDFAVHYYGRSFEYFVNAIQDANSVNFDNQELINTIKMTPNKDLIRKMASSSVFLRSNLLDLLISHLLLDEHDEYSSDIENFTEPKKSSESELILVLDAVKGIKGRTMYLRYSQIALYFFKDEIHEQIVDFFVEEINTNFGINGKHPYPEDPLELLFKYGKENNYAYARKILPRLNNPKDYLDVSKHKNKFLPLYNEIMNEGVLDTTIGLRSLNLPSLVVQNIASHAYDTTGFDTYKLISSINEHKTSNVMGAGQDVYDEQEYIDL